MLVKLVACILLSASYCDVALSQSAQSCANRSIEVADCLSKINTFTASAICNDASCFGPVLGYYRDCVDSSTARQLQEDCTRNIYGRLCSQIAYFLPNECFSLICDSDCKQALETQYGCCARSSFAFSLQSVAISCNILQCPLPSSGRVELYTMANLLLALVFTAGATIFSTLCR